MSDAFETAQIPKMSSADVVRHVEAGDAFVLDLRRHPHGKQIYGAVRYDPAKLLAAEKLILPLPKEDGLIVLYDEDGSSSTVSEIGVRLREAGYADIHALDGGFDGYRAANGKLEEATIEQPVPIVSEHQIER